MKIWNINIIKTGKPLKRIPEFKVLNIRQ
jgi:hypothetical protein